MNVIQESLLIKEGYLASTSIGYGLTALRKAGVHNKGDYYQAFFQLGIGLERIMKLIIIQCYRGQYARFPDNKTMKSFSHRLSDLFDYVVSLGQSEGIEFDEKLDDISARILRFLSDFSMSDRYYNIDYLTGRRSSVDPLVQWVEIQDEILERCIVRKKKRDVQREILNRILQDKSFVIVYNEKNELVMNTSEYILGAERAEVVQGHAVYFTLNIIRVLATILEEIEYKYHLYPNLKEFLDYYNYDYSKSEIIKKKKWTNS